MSRNRLAIFPVAVLSLFVLAACGGQPSAEQETSKIVQSQQDIYTKNQPIPVYDYSATRDILNQINNATVPELRPSWHVFSTPGVGVTDSCAGMGVAIPYSTQLTNPEYIASSHGQGGYIALPQPEPDGTYKPDATAGTYVLCDFGNGLEPVYVEDMVRTYFHPVRVEDGAVVHEKTKASITIDVKK